MRRFCLATAMALMFSPAAAQDAGWPAEFATIIEEARQICDGDFSVYPESVVQRDLNGDGTPDWILDEAGFTCSTTTSLYCGTGGCSVHTLINGVPGSLLLNSWDTATDSGVTYLTAPNRSGETVRFLWNNNEWVLQ